MVRKTVFRLLVTLSVLAVAASAWGVTAAQQAKPTPQPAAQATTMPAAQPATSASTTTTPERPFLGVRLEDTPDGVVVREVIEASPAALGGVMVNDVLQKVNTSSVANVMETAKALDALKIGDKVTFDVMRDGKAMTLTATVGKISETAMSGLPTNIPFDAIGYSTDKSWQVFNVADTSDLYKAGLRAGDQIMQFNGKAYTPTDLRTLVAGLKDSDSLKLSVQRAGKAQDITVQAPAMKSLDLFGYTDQGVLFNLIAASGKTTPSTANLLNLPTNEPFAALGYTGTDKSWMVFGLPNGSDLYSAGLRAGDQISQIDGKTYDPAGLQTYRQSLADNATVKLTVQRAGKTQDISVPASDLNGLAMFNYEQGGLLFGLPVNSYGPWLGADIINLNVTVAKQHQLTINNGMLITGILPDSPAAKAGLQPNDVITKVDATALDATHNWQSIIAQHKIGDQVKLDVQRAGKDMQIQATLGAPAISGDIPNLMPAF
ncbi:MAG: PDZ domain-containing protein [Chloroflexota bacterium]